MKRKFKRYESTRFITVTCQVMDGDRTGFGVGEARTDEEMPNTRAFLNAKEMAELDLNKSTPLYPTLPEVGLEDRTVTIEEVSSFSHKAEMDDNDVVLFGKYAGRKFGDIKDLPEFRFFVGKIIPREDRYKADEAKFLQLKKLKDWLSLKE